MISKWETEEERLRRFMKIPPKQKLEWLREMQEFNAKSLPLRVRSIRLKMRTLERS